MRVKLFSFFFFFFFFLQEMEGFSAGPKLDKLGMRGSNTSELIFDNVRVPGKLNFHHQCSIALCNLCCSIRNLH